VDHLASHLHRLGLRRLGRAALPALAAAASLGACLTNVPDPSQAGIYACVDSDDCPGGQSCLQKTCEAIELPVVKIVNPEDEKPLTFKGDGVPHTEVLTVNATNLTLRELSASNEAVPGEGHLVVFLDEEEVGKIETGDLTGGVQMELSIPDVPGVHRIRVQARLNDGTDYDHEGGAARNLLWVADGEPHVAIRDPWPGTVFTLESQGIDARVAVIGDIQIGPPMTGLQHVHIYYDKTFPMCKEDLLCATDYSGVVPDDKDEFGPVFLPEAGAGPVTLTGVIANANHTLFTIGEGEEERIVFSEPIEILRSNNL